jgi:hypothetical protein
LPSALHRAHARASCSEPDPKPELRADICKRAHELDPRVPASPDELTIVRDIVGFRPGRTSGLRVAAEVVAGAKVVHAYGAWFRSHAGGGESADGCAQVGEAAGML